MKMTKINNMNQKQHQTITNILTARVSQVPTRLGNFGQRQHTTKEAIGTEEYGTETVNIIAHIIYHYSNPYCKMMRKGVFYQLVQIYSIQKGIKKFGIRGKRLYK